SKLPPPIYANPNFVGKMGIDYTNDVRPQDLNKYSIKLEVPGDYQTLPLGKPDALYRVWVCKKLP
ncbi:MAG: hypothetical protein VX869_02040, partial [Chloroflexota bacterium]|nr:hypothetical protein [Chloroflexota bacterium]